MQLNINVLYKCNLKSETPANNTFEKVLRSVVKYNKKKDSKF